MNNALSSGTPADSGLGTTRHGFELAGTRFLIPLGLHAELSARPPICAIPDTPTLLLGFINHRGETLPVFDLDRLTGSYPANAGRWVLRLGKGAEAIGLLLNDLPHGLLGGEAAASDAPPPSQLSPFCGQGYRQAGEQWWEFDHPRFCAFVRHQFGTPS